jgi:uncharacterized repeat protein (TIGR01451 family)
MFDTDVMGTRRSNRSWVGMATVPLVALVLVCAGLLGVSPAVATTVPGAALTVHSFAKPSSFSAGDTAQCIRDRFEVECDIYLVTVRNVGSRPTDGGAITISDTLPAGVTAQRVSLWRYTEGRGPEGGEGEVAAGSCEAVGRTVRCGFAEALAPDGRLEMSIYVTVEPGVAGPLTNTAMVSGGGAAEVSTSVQNQIDSTSLFGVADFLASSTRLDGAPDTQAGGHPYEFATRIDLNNKIQIISSGTVRLRIASSVQDVRDVVVDLPLGFLGSALAAPKCKLAQLTSSNEFGSSSGCPPDTKIGHILTEPGAVEAGADSGIYNMVPEHGVAAELGFLDVLKTSHVLYASVVPTPAGYVLRTTAPETPQIPLSAVELEFYGDPAARDGSGNAPVAFFTNPSDCTGAPLLTGIHIDSWQNPGRFNADGTPDLSDPAWAAGTSHSPPVTGCNLLRFEPGLSLQPETMVADTPTGLGVDLRVPQSEDPGALATPPLRDATVTLPAGLALNPAAAGGLGACSEAQIGWRGGSLSDFTASAPSCPEDSKIGTVEVETPALSGVLEGTVYLAAQNENPFHSLLAGYIVIDDPTTGVVIKIPGNLTPDPRTGQITAVFKENPQFPFSELKLHFFGGPRGELATPTTCGTYTTTSDLMPWSAPDSGPDATPSDAFSIASGCTSAFAPGFAAGSTGLQAGGYAPFALSIARNDGEQNLAGVNVSLPQGLLGKIAGIPLCPDANANAGTCPETARVGVVQASAGAGPDPYFVSGKAYLTGPYNGGPYGLVVEVPAVAGPFNLGTVVVRQSLRIDPHTSQVTAVSDPLPTILQGIPLRIRRVDVTLDRPGFTFNPTNCTPMAVTGAVTSTAGATANVSSRFQVDGCRDLPFKPSFTVSTQANTSKKNGASLDVKVGYPQGAQANIRSVAVTLPKQLPSRLTTIQQACTEAAFNANPASCPAGSNIGVATARTPVLTNPLTGPAYLVSHGGAAFPDVVIVFQGEGVTLDVVGSVNIKKQITSSTFATIPDAPISNFELKLPEGPHSGLAAVVPAKAKGNLCGQTLTMPTTITGQNGAQIKQNTKIAVTGCPKAKKKPKHRGAKGNTGKKGKKGK